MAKETKRQIKIKSRILSSSDKLNTCKAIRKTNDAIYHINTSYDKI